METTLSLRSMPHVISLSSTPLTFHLSFICDFERLILILLPLTLKHHSHNPGRDRNDLPVTHPPPVLSPKKIILPTLSQEYINQQKEGNEDNHRGPKKRGMEDKARTCSDDS